MRNVQLQIKSLLLCGYQKNLEHMYAAHAQYITEADKGRTILCMHHPTIARRVQSEEERSLTVKRLSFKCKEEA